MPGTRSPAPLGPARGLVWRKAFSSHPGSLPETLRLETGRKKLLLGPDLLKLLGMTSPSVKQSVRR